MCHIDVEPGKTAVKTCFRANSACPCDLNMHNAYRTTGHTHTGIYRTLGQNYKKCPVPQF